MNKNMNETTPVKRCSICGEKGRGFNFKSNLVTCNACKQFFYRYSNKFHEFKYPRKGSCCIDSVTTRSDCKKCRIDKCLAIGMKIDRKNLINKKLDKKNNVNKNNNDNNQIVQIKNKTKLNKTNLANILEKIIENETNQDSDEPNLHVICVENTLRNSLFFTNSECNRISEVVKALITLEDERNYCVIGRTSDFLEAFKIPHENIVRQVISFCHSMSPFNMLSNNEQLQLLKLFFCEVMFVKTAFGYDRHNDGIYVLKDEIEKHTLLIPFSAASNSKHKNSVAEKRKLVISLGNLMENDEIVRDLILALLLFSPRNENPLPEFMRYNYIMYCYLLKRFLENKYQDTQQADTKFNRIMSILEKVGQVRQFISLILSECTLDNQIPQIVFEIHDLI